MMKKKCLVLVKICPWHFQLFCFLGAYIWFLLNYYYHVTKIL